jgi:integrase
MTPRRVSARGRGIEEVESLMQDDSRISQYDHGPFVDNVRQMVAGRNTGKWQMLVPIAPGSKRNTKKVIDDPRVRTRKQAVAFRASHVTKQRVGLIAGNEKVTLHELLEEYVSDRAMKLGEGEITQSTYESDMGYAHFVRAYFGVDFLAGALDKQGVDVFMKEVRLGKLRVRPAFAGKDWKSAPLSGSYSNKILNVLSKLMEKAIRVNARTDNPCGDYDRPSGKPRRKPIAIDAEQRTRLIAALEEIAPKPYPALIAFYAFGGARNKEGAGLAWTRIDHEDRVIEINEQLERKKKGVKSSELKPLKTIASKRFVPLVEELDCYLGLEAKKEEQKRTSFSHFCFAHIDGQPVRNNIQRYLTQACEKAGLPRLVPHDLRHSFGSILLEEGVPLTRVSRLLGHEDVEITARIYAHALASDRDIAKQEAARRRKAS